MGGSQGSQQERAVDTSEEHAHATLEGYQEWAHLRPLKDVQVEIMVSGWWLLESSVGAKYLLRWEQTAQKNTFVAKQFLYIDPTGKEKATDFHAHGVITCSHVEWTFVYGSENRCIVTIDSSGSTLTDGKFWSPVGKLLGIFTGRRICGIGNTPTGFPNFRALCPGDRVQTPSGSAAVVISGPNQNAKYKLRLLDGSTSGYLSEDEIKKVAPELNVSGWWKHKGTDGATFTHRWVQTPGATTFTGHQIYYCPAGGQPKKKMERKVQGTITGNVIEWTFTESSQNKCRATLSQDQKSLIDGMFWDKHGAKLGDFASEWLCDVRATARAHVSSIPEAFQSHSGALSGWWVMTSSQGRTMTLQIQQESGSKTFVGRQLFYNNVPTNFYFEGVTDGSRAKWTFQQGSDNVCEARISNDQTAMEKGQYWNGKGEFLGSFTGIRQSASEGLAEPGSDKFNAKGRFYGQCDKSVVPLEVFTQTQGTCYAHAIATVIRAAEERRGRTPEPLLNIVEQIVWTHGPNGGITTNVLAQECKPRNLKWAEVDRAGAEEAVHSGRAVLLTYRLTDPDQWDRHGAFFQEFPKGILTADHLTGPEVETAERTGHAVVIADIDDVNGAFVLKNSWGSNFADNGFYRVSKQPECVLMMEMKFYDVGENVVFKPSEIRLLATSTRETRGPPSYLAEADSLQ